MKRILIFSMVYYPRFVGGAEVALKEITDRFTEEEFEFHLITLRFDSALAVTERIGNVTVHRIGWSSVSPSISDLGKPRFKLLKIWYQFVAAFYAMRLHRQYRFDGIWAMMAHANGVPAAIFKLFRPKVPYLLTLQEGDPPERIERSMWPVWLLFKRAFTSADSLQAISIFLGAWGERMGFRGKPQIIPNGVSVNMFSREIPESEVSAMRSSLGRKDGETWLIHTGRLVHKNGIDTVIRSLALLPESVHFLQVGIGPDEAGLRSLVQSLDVASRVHFVSYVPQEQLPLYLRASDIFIRPSRSEGMGNSFIEAMAAGLPVIGTQEGGIADFLFDAKRNPDTKATGFAVDVHAPQQIADMVTYIQTHAEEVAETTARAKRMVAERYDWNQIASAMQKLFVILTTPSR